MGSQSNRHNNNYPPQYPDYSTRNQLMPNQNVLACKKCKEKNAYEAIILSQLNHNAIPELLGVVNKKGFYGFVLEQKPGYTVKEIFFKHKRCFSNHVEIICFSMFVFKRKQDYLLFEYFDFD